MQRAAEAESRGSDDDGGDNRSRSLEPEELGQSVMHVYQDRVEPLALGHSDALKIIPRQQQTLDPDKELVLHFPAKLLEDLLGAHQFKERESMEKEGHRGFLQAKAHESQDVVKVVGG